MSWKDRWTALMWRITFPGEAIPLDILPSNYARPGPPDEPKKTKIEDALTQATIMDMEAYPSQWSKKDPRWTFDNIKYINKEANVEVIIDGIRDHSATINGTEIGNENRKKIIKAFQNRFAAEVLERLLDRVEKIETVTVEEVKEEARPKLVDPFAVSPMEKLAEHLEALKRAAEAGKSLPPPPRKLISNSHTTSVKKLPKPNKYTQSTTRELMKPSTLTATKKPKKLQISTFRGKPVSKLSKSEMRDLVDYSFGREF